MVTVQRFAASSHSVLEIVEDVQTFKSRDLAYDSNQSASLPGKVKRQIVPRNDAHANKQTLGAGVQTGQPGGNLRGAVGD